MIAQFSAKCANVDIDGSYENQGIATECSVDEFRSIEGSSGLSDQGIEESEFAFGNFEDLIADHSAKAASIDGDALPRHQITDIFGRLL